MYIISFCTIFPQHFKGPSSSHLITGLYLKSDIAGRLSSVFSLEKFSPKLLISNEIAATSQKGAFARKYTR